jgi:hypothetical protein
MFKPHSLKEAFSLANENSDRINLRRKKKEGRQGRES